MTHIHQQTEGGGLEPGDCVTALITMFEKRKRSQWIIYLEAVAPNAEESARKPRTPMVLYSSFGATQKCISIPAPVVVRTIGPFVESSKRGTKAPEKRARFALDEGFLKLGLHHAAAVFFRLEQGAIRGTWSVSNSPFSETKIAEGRRLADQLQIAANEEQALIGAVPALMSYLDAVRNTPGLSDILFEILDLPSAWSMLRNAGIKSIGLEFKKGTAPGQAAAWGLPDLAPIYYVPMILEMNHQAALKLTFVVTSPHPPLLACAGVVGMLAEKPDDPQKYLTLRVISARLKKRQ